VVVNVFLTSATVILNHIAEGSQIQQWFSTISLKGAKLCGCCVASLEAASLYSSRTCESIITPRCDLTAEIQHRVNLASASFGRLPKRVFTNRDLSTRTKMAVHNAVCVSTLLYACEGWTPHRRHMRALKPFTFGVFILCCTNTGGTKYLMLSVAAEQAQHLSRRYSSEDN